MTGIFQLGKRSAIYLYSSLLLVLAACGSTADISGTGFATFGITDAPVDDAERVVIEIAEIILLKEDEQVSLTAGLPRQIDLLSLQGGLQDILIDEAAIPVGEYSEIRLKLNAVASNCRNLSPPYPSFITVDGVDYPLAAPSSASSGVKVKGDVSIASGEVSKFVIDFDLRKSIAQRSGGSCYNLKPVLRLVEQDDAGVIFGQVDAALLQDSSCTSDPQSGAGAAVYVFSGGGVDPVDIQGTEDDPVTTASLQVTDDGFEYTAAFLPPGEYTAALSCQAGDDRIDAADAIAFAQSSVVSVGSGSQSQVDFEINSVGVR
ncbi:MAG: DUF4382 domain-containing protein [Oceanococcus sp.]